MASTFVPVLYEVHQFGSPLDMGGVYAMPAVHVPQQHS